jgi:hypothetical protein
MRSARMEIQPAFDPYRLHSTSPGEPRSSRSASIPCRECTGRSPIRSCPQHKDPTPAGPQRPGVDAIARPAALGRSPLCIFLYLRDVDKHGFQSWTGCSKTAISSRFRAPPRPGRPGRPPPARRNYLTFHRSLRAFASYHRRFGAGAIMACQERTGRKVRGRVLVESRSGNAHIHASSGEHHGDSDKDHNPRDGFLGCAGRFGPAGCGGEQDGAADHQGRPAGGNHQPKHLWAFRRAPGPLHLRRPLGRRGQRHPQYAGHPQRRGAGPAAIQVPNVRCRGVLLRRVPLEGRIGPASRDRHDQRTGAASPRTTPWARTSSWTCANSWAASPTSAATSAAQVEEMADWAVYTSGNKSPMADLAERTAGRAWK